MRPLALAVFLTLAPAAWAAGGVVLYHSGRLLGADDAPVTSQVTLTVSLYDAATGGTAIWTESYTETPFHGVYAIALGDTTDNKLPLSASDVAGDRWLEVKVGSLAMSPRLKLAAVPRALNADNAVNVAGGTANVTSLAVGAASVDATGAAKFASVAIGATAALDSTGHFVGPTDNLPFALATDVYSKSAADLKFALVGHNHDDRYVKLGDTHLAQSGSILLTDTGDLSAAGTAGVTLSANVQNGWQVIAEPLDPTYFSLPGNSPIFTGDMQSATNGNLIYLGNGVYHGGLFLAISPDGGLLQLASEPTARRNGNLVACGGKIYAMGGGGSGWTATQAVDVYDPATNFWNAVPNGTTGNTAVTVDPLPSAFGVNPVPAVCVPSQNAIFLLAGGSTNPSYALNLGTNHWGTLTINAAPGRWHGNSGGKAVLEANGKVLVVGGTDVNGNPIAFVDEYDPSSNAWTAKTDLPSPSSGHGLHLLADGRIYLMGGSNGHAIWAYDPRATNPAFADTGVSLPQDINWLTSAAWKGGTEVLLTQGWPNAGITNRKAARVRLVPQTVALKTYKVP